MRRLTILALCLSSLAASAQTSANKTHNILFVMTDGMRWQEMFHGADPTLLTPERNWHGRSVDGLKKQFLVGTPEENRTALMPFVWGTIARQGQIYGDRDEGSQMYVTNGLNFSYPGYNETLTGYPNAAIDSNDPIPNPHATVLEWLNNKPAFHGQVAAFAAWDVFTGIFNAGRCGFPVNVSYDPLTIIPMTPQLKLINEWKAESPKVWDDESFDAPTFYTAVEYIKAKKPRVLFLSLGETDDWAHANEYGEYLLAAHRADDYLRRLWDMLQSMPEYKDNTTLVFLTDHGRGSGPKDWTDHGQKIPDSKNMWAMFLGPDTPALGIRKHIPDVTQGQIAATVAQFLGENYDASVPEAAKPIAAAEK
jgi:hypothetical protein